MKWECSRGQALVETVIIIPLVFLVFLAMVQVGLLMHTKVLMEMAVRMGLRLEAAQRDAEKQMRDFLLANSVVRDLKYRVRAGGFLYVDEVIVECDFPVFGIFQDFLGPSVHLRSRLCADGGGIPFLDWLYSALW